MSRDYFSEFETQQEKLEVLLEENDLLHEFDTERYPITLTIRPNITPEAQMALFDRAAEGVSSRDAALVFQFLVAEINVRVYGRLVISDALMSKINNDEGGVVIEPREYSSTALTISGWQANVLFYLLIIIIPLGTLALGVIVWLRRRHL